VIRFGQNQNLECPKHSISYGDAGNLNFSRFLLRMYVCCW